MSLVLALCNRVARANGDAAPERQILDSLRVLEGGAGPGGKMGLYRINANTSAHDVVRGIADGTPFCEVRDRYLEHSQTQSKLIPLARVEALMVQPLAQAMREFLGERLRCNARVARIEIDDGLFHSFTRDDRLLARSRSLLLCCGAREETLPELRPLQSRWEGSGQFLLRDHLDGLPDGDGPVVIVGASHSAFSCAWRLLHDPLFEKYAGDRDIVILQRRARIKIRCTPDFAARHAIEYDPERDVCPYSGMVYRNGGLRKDAKKLFLQIRDGREKRVRLAAMTNLAEHRDLLDRAGLILQATGFVADLPDIRRGGVALEVGNPSQHGELHDLQSDLRVPGLFGMGLGLNILPQGSPRGEASFNGGIHGFQSYPLSIAPGLIDRLVETMAMETRH